jgi:8-oxo-dGTP pyrophosphatase MutT (NUDIX family)
VEDNVIAGITNNVFGTKCVADFAHRFGAEKFVLVSTDKAVRPTNVMGASKRLAELVIQDLSKSSETIFTMVRFGNVLGSSGSVIPKFKSQINAGGPITVTHEEITRYFMSIPEAAHLVLNAGTFANGGDVFLLDMGDPVKILELAKSMVRQHGLQPVLDSEIAEQQKKDNEILIVFSGLRPGEKLFEELLVDGEAQDTPNSKIFKSHDGVLEGLDLGNSLRLLQESINGGDTQAILKQLYELPLSYQPSTGIAIKPSGHDNFDKANIMVSEASLEQNGPRNTVVELEYPSLLKRVVSSKVGLALLHRYFLLTRGMTLGVRVLVQNLEGEILVVKHSYVPGWHLPGGGVDHGEDVETAARREVYEETGISELIDLNFSCLKHNFTVSDRDHVTYFEGRTNQKVSMTRNSEISEVQFVSRDVVIEIIAPEYREYMLENV